MPILITSLSQIKSFGPCLSGWKDILIARGGSCANMVEEFPLIDCLESNSFSDVIWLLKNRKAEISICAKAARLCADSVRHIKNTYADAAADAAFYATTVATAAANAANVAADYAIYAAANAADYDAAGAATYSAAKEEQKQKNKQFLHEAILMFESTKGI